jgi:hypothetical protein
VISESNVKQYARKHSYVKKWKQEQNENSWKSKEMGGVLCKKIANQGLHVIKLRFINNSAG